jgi:uncharacterized protein with HEPN domain
MSRNLQRLADYLDHIFQAIERIQRYTHSMEEATFLQNEMVQDAVIRNLEIMGEASRNITRDHPEFVAAHPELPLISAYEMRNALSHGYFQIDLIIVWRTIESDLSPLKEQVSNLKASMTHSAGGGTGA